jgi:hypothetical protein
MTSGSTAQPVSQAWPDPSRVDASFLLLFSLRTSPGGRRAHPPPPHGVPIRSGMPRHGRSGSRERRRASHLGSVHDSSREANACFQIGRGDGVPTVTSYPGQAACHCAPRHTSSASRGGEVEATVLGDSGNGGAVPFGEDDRRGFQRWRR